MTTNIFDSNGSVMATDSRWSVRFGNWIMYLDDAGYDKILLRNNKALMFAGFGAVIQQWKDWINSNPTSAVGMPPHKGMSVCMVDIVSKKVDFDAQQDIISDGVYCAGSGAYTAYSCWLDNKCALKAVETAKNMDLFSGGEVKFYKFDTQEHNLSYPLSNVTIGMVDALIKKRGLVMKLNVTPPGNAPFPLAAAANDCSDEEVATVEIIRSKISSGELSANAPCSGMYNDWSEENKDKFTDALGKMFGWN